MIYYAQLTLAQVSENVHSCECPIVDVEIKRATEWWDHPDGHTKIIVTEHSEILQSPDVIEIDGETAYASKVLWDQMRADAAALLPAPEATDNGR